MNSMQPKTGRHQFWNLSLFSSGKLISVFGTAIYTFAIGLYVLNMTGSSFSFATNLLLWTLPALLFGPIAGVLADRFHKKNIVVTTDLLNGLLFLVLFYISTRSKLSLPIIYASTFLSTTLTTFFTASIDSAKPQLVSEHKLMNLNSISRIIDESSSILGPMIGGFIFALVDMKLFILINGISFILSAILEMFIDFRYNVKEAEVPEPAPVKNKPLNIKNDLVVGLQFLRSRKDLVSILIIVLGVNFFLGFSVIMPIPYLINNVLALSGTYNGIIQGALPAGIIIGAFFVKWVTSRYPYRTIMWRVSSLFAINTILLGLPLVFEVQFAAVFYLFYYVIIMLIYGILVSLVDIPAMYIFQKTVSDAYRGRVMSISATLGKVLMPIAFILSGFLLGVVQSSVVIISGGILMFVFVSLTMQRVREYIASV